MDTSDKGPVSRLARRIIESERSPRIARSCYHAYSVLFVPLCMAVFVSLPLNGRELIWNVDGLSQYYSFFVYEGEWIRGIVASLFLGRGPQVPLWEWCMGYGADVPATFDVFLDPLNLVSAITPPPLTEWVFQLLVLLRLYLSGIAFVFYCRTRRENRTGTVLGALLYALCGAGLTGVRWSSGLHALMLFPVILAGAERILQGKRPWVFVGSFAALAIISYYFTYMAGLLLVGYLTVRVVMVEGRRLTPRRFLRWVAVFAGLVALCLAIAGFALLPAGAALLGMDRLTDTETVVPLLYSPSYYLHLLTSFLSVTEVGSDTCQGFGGLAFLALVALFSQREWRELKLVFAALTVILLLPWAGSALNVMNYATNRWTWAYDLCVALVLVRVTPALLAPDASLRRTLVLAGLGYGALLLIPGCRTEANVAGMAALLVALLLVLHAHGNHRVALTLALAVTLAVNGLYQLSPNEGGQGSGQVPLGMARTKLTTASANVLATEVEDEGWWRYDGGQVYLGAEAPLARIRNDSLVLGLHGIDFYNSIYNDRIDAFHTDLAIASDYINFSYNDLQGRSDPMALLGVKYYLYRADGTDAPPYGFSMENTVVQHPVMDVDYQLLRADAWLPLGMAFERSLSYADYLGLTPAQRQQALLQAVVLEDGTSGVAQDPAAGATPVRAEELSFEDEARPFSVAAAVGVEMEGKQIVVTDPGATLTLSFEGTPHADTFAYFKGLRFHDRLPSELVSDEEMEGLMWYHHANLMVKDLTHQSPINYWMHLKTDVSPMTGYLNNYVPTYHMYGGKDTWLVGLGYADAPATQVSILFSTPGVYTFDDLQVITQTHEQREEWMRERQAEALQDVELGCNRLTGTIDLDGPRTLLLTVAYGKGWSAYVDGRPAPLRPGDTGFMALDLAAGHHDIELRYMTPGLLPGLAVSCAGIACLTALGIMLRRKGATAQGNTEE